LRQWEAREKRKASDYDYERDDDEAKRSKSEKDKKRLMEFLEHYDDDKSDNRYYKVGGSGLMLWSTTCYNYYV
jgi:RNA-binding protein 25